MFKTANELLTHQCTACGTNSLSGVCVECNSITRPNYTIASAYLGLITQEARKFSLKIEQRQYITSDTELSNFLLIRPAFFYRIFWDQPLFPAQRHVSRRR